jgi:diguanylate cyclase (GGDEF)-like protein
MVSTDTNRRQSVSLLEVLRRHTAQREELQEERRQEEHNKFTVFIVRLDNFLEIENKLGTQKAQETSLRILGTLGGSIRSVDVLRVTGRNEVILLAKVSKEKAALMIARWQMRLKDCTSEVGEELRIELSFGCATYPDDASTSEDLLRKAYETIVTCPSN